MIIVSTICENFSEIIFKTAWYSQLLQLLLSLLLLLLPEMFTQPLIKQALIFPYSAQMSLTFSSFVLPLYMVPASSIWFYLVTCLYPNQISSFLSACLSRITVAKDTHILISIICEYVMLLAKRTLQM